MTLLARGGILALGPYALEADPDGYRALAENLLEHGTFGRGRVPTAYRPPLYPLVLVPCVALGPWRKVGVAALHVVLGVATVWLVERLGRRWGLGRWSLFAGALVACDPILLAQSTLVMTETLAAFLAVVGLAALTAAAERPTALGAACAGACLALASLARPTFFPWAGLAALALAALAPSWAGRLRVLACFTAGAVLVLCPWIVRNQARFGRPVVATTHGGYTLLLGNNPSFYQHLRNGAWGSVWDAAEFQRSWRAKALHGGPDGELKNDRRAYAEAWQYARREPGMFAYSCLVRAVWLWAVLPHQVDPAEGLWKRVARYMVAGWYAAEFALAIAGIAVVFAGGSSCQSWKTTWIWGFLLAACFTAMHTLYWSNMRMRAPLVPVVALAAAAGTAWIGSRMLGCKHHSDKGIQSSDAASTLP